MKIIYWNTKQHSNYLAVLEILTEEIPDVMFLAECDSTLILSNLSDLNINGYEHFENPGCSRITIVKKISTNFSLSKQSTYYSSIKDPCNNVNIISVHLPSQLYQHIDGLKNYFRNLRIEIDSDFGSSLTSNILLIGDFNVNPFDKPMIDFDGFAASNSKKLKGHITHLGERKELYYNPTWTLYNNNSFPGTKYFRRPSNSAFDILEHHFLDQVIMSYHMSQNITLESMKVLEMTTSNIFFDSISNSIKISDHLPIIFEYKI